MFRRQTPLMIFRSADIPKLLNIRVLNASRSILLDGTTEHNLANFSHSKEVASITKHLNEPSGTTIHMMKDLRMVKVQGLLQKRRRD